MNSHDEIHNTDEQTPNTPKKRGRRRLIVYSLAGLVGILGITSISAIAKGGSEGWCRGGYERMHWGGNDRGEGFKSAKIRKFAAHRVDRVLNELDATPEQHQQVKEILDRAFENMGSRHEMRQRDRQAFIAILSQPEIDRAKLQTLRVEKITQMEKMSERMVQAVADAAEVLTPEQRVKLGEMMEQRGFGPGRHRW